MNYSFCYYSHSSPFYLSLYNYSQMVSPQCFQYPQGVSSAQEPSFVKQQDNVSSAVQLQQPQRNQILHQKRSVQKKSRYIYAKKNVQSNVVNQILSFITTKNKSYRVLWRILESNEKIDDFYQILKQTKKKEIKGYIGRNTLQSLLEADEDHSLYILQRKLKKNKVHLKFRQIQKALRILTNYFLKSMIVPTILTSSKIDKATVRQHLGRARDIYSFINDRHAPHSS